MELKLVAFRYDGREMSDQALCEAQAKLTIRQVLARLGQWETLGRNKRLAHYENVIEELRKTL